ncbi:MAG TPA: CAAX prenyl protease-related protein [Bryobacteraceae bacterium]|nr:CAAX prenyl protease-related protein [Bryobacteraceae bacterium]
MEYSPAGSTPRYVVPFLAFLAFLALHSLWPLPPRVDFLLRDVTIGAVLMFYSRPVIVLRTRFLVASAVLGLIVFLIWIGPDVLFPAYRRSVVFQNSLTGLSRTSLPQASLSDPVVLVLRVVQAVVIVPIIEELFWRAWLLRWLISPRFAAMRMGTYNAAAFWIVALLFASEHGPWWDVGLIAGIAYNWWIVRTKSLADCILAHAVTNALLCAWVITRHQWQYWL